MTLVEELREQEARLINLNMLCAEPDCEGCHDRARRATTLRAAIDWIEALEAELEHWKSANLYPATYREAVEKLKQAIADLDAARAALRAEPGKLRGAYCAGWAAAEADTADAGPYVMARLRYPDAPKEKL